MPENEAKRPLSPPDWPQIDPHDDAEVRAYFARLEREYPQLVEAMKVMNISCQQYWAAMRAMNQQSSISSGSAQSIL